MARVYGTIIASSVPSESVFGIAGLQITKCRNRLALKTMGVMMCLRSLVLIQGRPDYGDDDSDDNDVRKDREYGMAELDKVQVNLQAI